MLHQMRLSRCVVYLVGLLLALLLAVLMALLLLNKTPKMKGMSKMVLKRTPKIKETILHISDDDDVINSSLTTSQQTVEFIADIF